MAGESSGKFTRYIVGATISAPHTNPPEEICVKKSNINVSSQELNVTCSKSGGVKQYETGLADLEITMTCDMHVGSTVYATLLAGNLTAFQLRVWDYAPPGTDLSTVAPDWNFSALKTFKANQTSEVDGLVTFDFTFRIASGGTYTAPSAL